MKILQVIPSFTWRFGGPIFFAHGLSRELARRGHDVTVMTTNIDGPGVLDVPLGRPVSTDGFTVQYFPIEMPKWYYFSRPLSRALQRQVEEFDLVHIHSIFLWPPTIAAFWCRKFGVPYVIIPQGMLSPIPLAKAYDRWWVSMSSRIKKRIHLRTIGKADLEGARAIQFTTEVEMEAARPLGLRWRGSFIVPLGVELGPKKGETSSLCLREAYSQLKGRKVVLFLARLDPIKGLGLLIPALGELAAGRDDFAFVVAGSGDPAYEREVAALVRKHGLEGRTIFLGFVQGGDKWALLREADLFVLPSYHENFGVAVGEAMAAGLPVVISDHVHIHKEVRQAKAGIVTTLDAGEIAAAIQQLLDDECLRKKMGARGRQLVRERYAWERVTSDMLQVYADIIRGKPVMCPSPDASSCG